jgi:hypothetical protein
MIKAKHAIVTTMIVVLSSPLVAWASDSGRLTKLPETPVVKFGKIDYVPSLKKRNAAVEKAILAAMHTPGKPVCYLYNLVDLNGDGKQEAVAYILSCCGSGGCNMLILQPKGAGYRLVTQMTVTQSPVVISKNKTNGWSDLIEYAEGGGMPLTYVVLRFNGRSYPTNPTVAPALPKGKVIEGTAIIADDIHPDSGLRIQ